MRKVLIISIAGTLLAGCADQPLPPGAYGRAPGYAMACEHWEGLQRVNERFAWDDQEGAKKGLHILWGSHSCISFFQGDPFFSDGQPNRAGFVKVGKDISTISYFTESRILGGRERAVPMAETKMIPVAPLDSPPETPRPTTAVNPPPIAPAPAVFPSAKIVSNPSAASAPTDEDPFFESLQQTITGAGYECGHVIVHYVANGLRTATCKTGNANATFSIAMRNGAMSVQPQTR